LFLLLLGCNLSSPRSMCCSLEEEEEKGPLRTAYTVSETVISQVSTSSNGLGEPALEPSAPEMEANSRNGTR